MGQVFGVTGASEPPYSAVWQSPPFEIRVYEPYFVAEVPMVKDAKGDDRSFMVLASYIGVFGTPKNQQKKAIAMTAPVVTGPQKIAMTTPVLTNPDYMQFVLPFEFRTFDDVPKPEDPSVTVRQVPQRVIAVNRFSGGYSEEGFKSKLVDLQKKLAEESLVGDGEMDWSFAQYNPPFCLPFLRRNEVWITVNSDQQTERLKQILSDASAKKQLGDEAKEG